MEPSTSKTSLTSLASRLVQDGLIAEHVAAQVMGQAAAAHVPFISFIVQQKLVSPTQIANVVAHDFGLPLLDLNAFEREQIPIKLVSEKLLRQHHMLPLLQKGKHLYVAAADPTNQAAFDEIKFHTGLTIRCVIVEEDKLTQILETALAAQETEALGDLSDTALDELSISVEEEEGDGQKGITSEAEDAPIVRYVQKILLDAIKKGASDIHFEPFEKIYRIRNRMDGILCEVATPPVNLAPRITARIKIMAQMDISERRIPQDGRFKMMLSKKRAIDFRVSCCPVVSGEKIVIRILDPTAASLSADALGFEPWQRDIFLKHISKPQGMMLVTGPTGSGKTITLYTALNILNTMEDNISTVEDPVEIYLPGVNQVNINQKAGLTFSLALRSFLRQDPDVIMVGEMRDLETAEIGVKASQTGHFVLSTLHTNSAPETLTRLVNMGVPGYNIATSVSLIVAQRLARKLCTLCKQEVAVPKEELLREGFTKEDIETIKVYGPVGCEHCNKGYKGRLGLFELLEISEAIGAVIMRGGNALDIIGVARKEGFQTLRDAGLKKVKLGLTSLEEINRVTKD